MSDQRPVVSPLRERVAELSRPVLTRLHGLPRLVVPLGTLALVAIGAFAPVPLALVAFILVFLFIAWISYLSWPAVQGIARVMRVAMLALVVVLAATRLA